MIASKNNMYNKNTIYKICAYLQVKTPSDRSPFTHVNGDHDHVSRYKSYYQKDKPS